MFPTIVEKVLSALAGGVFGVTGAGAGKTGIVPPGGPIGVIIALAP